MINQFWKSLVAVSIILVLGCAPEATIKGPRGEPMQAKQLEPYNGPKARIAVSRFDVKAAKVPKEAAAGLSDMLATALVNSNRFIVLERDVLDEVIKEQNLGAAGRANSITAPPVGQIEGAELLVTGTLTEYEPNHFSVGGVALGLLTGATSVILASKQSHMPLGAIMYTDALIGADIRVVDTRTSRVLLAATINADAKDFGGGIIGVVGGGSSTVPLGFGGFQHVGMKLAMRALLNKAVSYIVQNTPSQFYHYTSQVQAEPELIQTFAIRYKTLLKSYPPKTDYVFKSGTVWRKFEKKYFKKSDSVLPADTFNKMDIIAVFPKTKKKSVDLWVQKVVDRGTFIEVVLIEQPPRKPLPEKAELPLSYLLAGIPRLNKPVYFSRKIYGQNNK